MVETVIAPDGSQWTLLEDSCCINWVKLTDGILLGGYIAANSTYDPETEPYLPYINTSIIDEFYVPNNYNEDMPTPKKLLDIDNAPSLTAMDYFVGTNASGDYKFTPAQLVSYVAPLFRRTVTVAVAGSRVDVADLPPIIGIGSSPNYLGEGDFTQDANGFSATDGTEWDEGKKLTLFF